MGNNHIKEQKLEYFQKLHRIWEFFNEHYIPVHGDEICYLELDPNSIELIGKFTYSNLFRNLVLNFDKYYESRKFGIIFDKLRTLLIVNQISCPDCLRKGFEEFQNIE